MKIMILASAAVLSLGVGSAFAATSYDTPYNGGQSTTTNVQQPAPSRYAYNGQYQTAPQSQQTPVMTSPATPLGAMEAYQGDAMGAP